LKENKNITDVSAEYEDCTDTVNVHLRYPPVTPTGYVYLAFEHEHQLYPVAWAKDSGQTCRFPSVGRDVFYFPVYYANNLHMPAGDPFLLDSDGNTVILSPDNPDTLLDIREMDIYEGHDYELFGWTKDGWTSLGRQTATDSGSLQYRAPLQSLLYMENHTLQRRGKMFFVTPEHEIRRR
jgi:hypothetical protein